MEKLKEELMRKRKAMEELGGGRKAVRQGELERLRLEKLRQEERQELERKAALQRASAGNNKNSKSTSSQKEIANKAAVAALEAAKGEDVIDQLVLPRAEVVRRLRILKQPVTLFGEDDDLRLTRLKLLMKSGDIDLDGEVIEGQQNDFLRDMRNLKQGKVEVRKEKQKKKPSEKDQTGGDPNATGNGAGGGNEADAAAKDDEEDDIDFKRMRAPFEELCDEDKILVFCKRILKEWEKELDERPEAEKRTQQGRSIFATYRQCARYLDPLFRMCRRKQLYDDIREALLFMVDSCLRRDYLAAMDKYIKLAIGNAPWPIGVTMVGIHERSAREKIHTNSVAHIMNDETTRKYLQSVKRLMTLCQRNYPALPSKSVEFNSLANGSDLEKLLEEEAIVKEAHGVQKTPLRIMAAPMSTEAM
eukprot:TRINITY_DN35499_c0_g1_i1.p1 TRINITY_DN35499_c0_g1~~TRINITY_DN35499_c0_g1_i1.p1  ORF type:complete len:418 (+),score=96.53 TRINITY_DN35499_c0_g1_i1:364-1617(+)